MMRLIVRLLALGVLFAAAALVWTPVYIVTYADPDPLPEAAAIVVLSGPFMAPEGETDETSERVARGVALWQAGLAPIIVMSGGGSRALPGPGDAAFMAEQAIALGVPEAAIRTETRSQSTLQNALNTGRLDAIDPSAPILLVTHRYHLSRAVASFRWAGFTDVTAVAADPGAVQEITPALLLEGLKWPLNVIRAAGASAALALGAGEREVDVWLH